MTNVVRSDEMPDEIDFSGGIRGKFYRAGVRLNLPIYLDRDVLSYLSQVAAKKGLPVSEIVNDLLKKDIAIIESAK
jgi:hypothetical protein